jgi:hypothetical protein
METTPIVLGCLIIVIVIIGAASLINISTRKEGPAAVTV